MSSQATSSNTAASMLAFLLGASAGVTAALLFAPRTGQEARQRLKSKALETRDRVQHKLAQQKDAAQDALSEAAGTATEVMERAENKAQTMRRRSRPETTEPTTGPE
jgi:gas vesicle protein